jgi:catechol 2,3-dioxygenase
VWLHRKGNVHDLAFTNGMGPRLHHIGLWTASCIINEIMGVNCIIHEVDRGKRSYI